MVVAMTIIPFYVIFYQIMKDNKVYKLKFKIGVYKQFSAIFYNTKKIKI